MHCTMAYIAMHDHHMGQKLSVFSTEQIMHRSVIGIMDMNCRYGDHVENADEYAHYDGKR